MRFDATEVEIAVPARRLPAVRMAGFRQRAPVRRDIGMIAHPAVTLLIDLSQDASLSFDVNGAARRGSVVVGLLPGELHATGLARVDCLQIRLEPVAAAAVLGPAAELTGAVVALDEIWGAEAVRVEDRLRAATSWDDRFALAAELVTRRAAARRVDPEVAHAWRRTLGARGRLRVAGLADEVGWSRQRLWSRFRAQLGITPKHAARLIRFDHAAHLLAAGHPPAGVAAEGGYTDQSHLHREVLAFTGLSPAGVAAAPWLSFDDVAWP
ncbi:AraC-like DNA-binding protein [Actinoplanes octamycinicus]|uniref:AraC-like DNA-binding protein n=1 Tax=Actinoplanes octamycinicus TaxID=135948 RepID=A0A7W7M8W4_9ACTN|nr:helix-turn-helix domain-containing protein [Actinoplanes octamycinicus]MBB4741393.1 AraC-like DNA-binding protein [Actinoplanes octamycinicus]GIE62808.1 AraC family transcriptional regulator [Actinoplanes octamycinicus]